MKRKPKKVAQRWKPIQLPKELVDDLEAFANSKTAKSLGFTNKSQFAAFAIRKILNRYSEFLWVYELVDVTEEKVTIIDHEENQLVTLTLKGEFLICDKHKNRDCNHIDYASIIPRVHHMMKKWLLRDLIKEARKEQLKIPEKKFSSTF